MLILLVIPLTLVLTVIFPQLLGPLMLVVVIVLIWERVRINQAIAELAARITTGHFDTKLEVQEGAWGTLCHAVNNLVQQQRRQQYVQTLLPSLPSQAITNILSTHFPSEGTLRAMTVLVVGYTNVPARHASLMPEHLHALKLLSTVAHQQAEQHGALVERFGDMLLLAFGAFEERSLSTTLRTALHVAQELRQSWDDTSPRGSLAISLASGTALSVALPGLGYSVIGTPIEQALRLQHLAAACPEYALVCSEESYLNVRLLNSARWLPTDLRLLQPDQPPQVVYALPLQA